MTTSADFTTATTLTIRTVTTVISTQTATTTLPPIRARDANVFAAGVALFHSVVSNANGTSASASSTDIPASSVATSASPTPVENPQRSAAASSLANACSCKMVDPTATVTQTYTDPEVVCGFVLVHSALTNFARPRPSGSGLSAYLGSQALVSIR